DEHVKEALDLCLACKGCKTECPVGVDLATYKAEFLSHYYERHRRPLSAYAMGFIHRWARFASYLPTSLVALAHAPTSGLLKAMGVISAKRDVPRFARRTFVHQFHRRRSPEGSRSTSVVLWPDTFNNYFHPDTAMAAVDVLEAAGCDVAIPSRPM